MKKKISVVLIVLLLCTMLCGCSKSTNKDKEYKMCCKAHSTCGMCVKGSEK